MTEEEHIQITLSQRQEEANRLVGQYTELAGHPDLPAISQMMIGLTQVGQRRGWEMDEKVQVMQLAASLDALRGNGGFLDSALDVLRVHRTGQPTGWIVFRWRGRPPGR